MEALDTFEVYSDLRKRIRGNADIFFTNMYFSSGYLMDKINSHKVKYSSSEYSIQMLIEDDFVYNLFYYGNPHDDLLFGKLDKPILCKNVYIAEKHSNELELFEKMLSDNGFILDDSAYVISADVPKVYEKNKHVAIYLKTLEMSGFYISYIGSERMSEIYDFLSDSEYIKPHQFPGREVAKRIESNNGLCAILDSDNKIVAIMFTDIRSGTAEGIMTAVSKEYVRKGFGAALCYERFRYLNDLGIKVLSGSVDVKNLNSQKMFMSLGYTTTGKMTNEWILQ